MAEVAVSEAAGRGITVVRATERLYRSLFTASLVFGAVAAIWAVANQPLHELHAQDFGSALILGAVGFSLSLLALWQRSSLFELFREHPAWLLAAVAVAAGLLWADSDMDSSFYWLSLAPIAMAGVAADLRWTVMCALALAGALVFGMLVVHGYSLSQFSSAGLLDVFAEQLGGYLAAAAVVAVPMDRLAGYVGRINQYVAEDAKAVAAGGSVLSPARAATASLSAREVEVTQLVADGMSNEEIAGQLYLSPRTVQSHVASSMRKTTTRSRTELAVLAVREGLVPAGPEGTVARGAQ